MPIANGIEVAARLNVSMPKTPVVIFTMFEHHGRFRHADVKPCGNFYSVRNWHAKVQNYQIRLEGFRFMNCFVAVNRLTNFELRTAFHERPYGVSYRSFVLGNENAFGHGKNRGKA